MKIIISYEFQVFTSDPGFPGTMYTSPARIHIITYFSWSYLVFWKQWRMAKYIDSKMEMFKLVRASSNFALRANISPSLNISRALITNANAILIYARVVLLT